MNIDWREATKKFLGGGIKHEDIAVEKELPEVEADNLYETGGPKEVGPTYDPQTKKWTNPKGLDITGHVFKGSYGNTTYFDSGAVMLDASKVTGRCDDLRWRYAPNAPRLYIGGSTNEARLKYFDIDTELTNAVKAMAKQYGISPNALASRIAKEGPIDEAIRNYNNTNGYLKRDDMMGPIWGLDDMGTWISDGKIKLRDGFNIDTDIEMENENGRTTYSVHSKNYLDGVELTAAAFKYFKDQMRKRYPNASEGLLEQYAAAAFNNGMSGAVNLINQGKIKNTYKPFIRIKKDGGDLGSLPSTKFAEGGPEEEVKPFVDNRIITIENNGNPRIDNEGYTVDEHGNRIGEGFQLLVGVEPVAIGMSPETKRNMYELYLQLLINKYYDDKFLGRDALEIEKMILDEDNERALYNLARDAEDNRLVGAAGDAERNGASILPGFGYFNGALHGTKGLLDYAFGNKGLALYEFERAGDIINRGHLPTAITASLSTGNPYIAGAIDGTFVGSSLHDIDTNGLNEENSSLLLLSSLGPITRGIGYANTIHLLNNKVQLPKELMIGIDRKNNIIKELGDTWESDNFTVSMNKNEFVRYFSGLIEKFGEQYKPTKYRADGSIKTPGGERRIEHHTLEWIKKGALFNEGSYNVIKTAIDVAKKHGLTDKLILQFNSPYSLLDAYGEKPKMEPLDPNKEPTFTHALSLRDGIEVYKVDDTIEGLRAVRRMVDTHIGPEHSPWCVAAVETGREGVKSPWDFWLTYNYGDKYIAFKDGKLIAFKAGSSNLNYGWYNLHDKIHNGIQITEKEGGKTYSYEINDKNLKVLTGMYKGLINNVGINVEFDPMTEEPSVVLFVENDPRKTTTLVVFDPEDLDLYVLFGRIEKNGGINQYGLAEDSFVRENFVKIIPDDPLNVGTNILDGDVTYETRMGCLYSTKSGKYLLKKQKRIYEGSDFDVDRERIGRFSFSKDYTTETYYEEITDPDKIRQVNDLIQKAKLKYIEALKQIPDIELTVNNMKKKGGDKFGSIEPEPFEGTDRDLISNAYKYTVNTLKYWQGDGLKRELLDSGWTELEYNELLKEILRASGVAKINAKGVGEMSEYATHEGHMENDKTLFHEIDINRDRTPNLDRLKEAIYHEFGGHGITASIRPGKPNNITQAFPMIAKLMLSNAEAVEELVLKPEWRYIGKISDRLDREGWMNILDEWRKLGLSEEEVVRKYTDLEDKVSRYHKIQSYLRDPLEAATRLRVLKMFDMFENGKKTLNESSMEEAFTRGSVLKVKNKIFSTLPLLILAASLIDNDEPEVKSDGGKINWKQATKKFLEGGLLKIDWSKATRQYLNGGKI